MADAWRFDSAKGYSKAKKKFLGGVTMLDYNESTDVMDDHFIECERFWVREFKKEGFDGIELTIKAHEKALKEVPMEDPRSPNGEAIDEKARKNFIEWKTEVLRRYRVIETL